MTTASPMLNREQRCIIRRVTRRLGTVQQQTIGGFAGMGKSTHLCALADALPDFAVCAFTGRATAILWSESCSVWNGLAGWRGEHVAECCDPQCDNYCCRLARGWSLEDIEADIEAGSHA